MHVSFRQILTFGVAVALGASAWTASSGTGAAAPPGDPPSEVGVIAKAGGTGPLALPTGPEFARPDTVRTGPRLTPRGR